LTGVQIASGKSSPACDGALQSRRRIRVRELLLFAVSVIVPSAASALPLTPFRYEAQARRHCPVDTIIWLDFRKEVYYLKRQKRYGHGSTGSFVCQEEARAGGFRRSLLGIR
jgi:hypothetical protein